MKGFPENIHHPNGHNLKNLTQITITLEKANIEVSHDDDHLKGGFDFLFEFVQNEGEKLFESKTCETGHKTVSWSSQPFPVTITSSRDKYYILIYRCQKKDAHSTEAHKTDLYDRIRFPNPLKDIDFQIFTNSSVKCF